MADLKLIDAILEVMKIYLPKRDEYSINENMIKAHSSEANNTKFITNLSHDSENQMSSKTKDNNTIGDKEERPFERNDTNKEDKRKVINCSNHTDNSMINSANSTINRLSCNTTNNIINNTINNITTNAFDNSAINANHNASMKNNNSKMSNSFYKVILNNFFQNPSTLLTSNTNKNIYGNGNGNIKYINKHDTDTKSLFEIIFKCLSILYNNTNIDVEKYKVFLSSRNYFINKRKEIIITIENFLSSLFNIFSDKKIEEKKIISNNDLIDNIQYSQKINSNNKKLYNHLNNIVNTSSNAKSSNNKNASPKNTKLITNSNSKITNNKDYESNNDLSLREHDIIEVMPLDVNNSNEDLNTSNEIKNIFSIPAENVCINLMKNFKTKDYPKLSYRPDCMRKRIKTYINNYIFNRINLVLETHKYGKLQRLPKDAITNLNLDFNNKILSMSLKDLFTFKMNGEASLKLDHNIKILNSVEVPFVIDMLSKKTYICLAEYIVSDDYIRDLEYLSKKESLVFAQLYNFNIMSFLFYYNIVPDNKDYYNTNALFIKKEYYKDLFWLLEEFKNLSANKEFTKIYTNNKIYNILYSNKE